MLSPNTAAPGSSIWDSVGRTTYENHVVALSALGCVPGSHVYNEEEWPQQRSPELVSFALERQIADDLAFIAAYDYGVRCVTAATVVASSDPPSLVIRLAANEGIQDCVKRAFEHLIQTLKSCASKELSIETCAEDAFDTIVVLNINRIFGRLESRWFHRPSYESGPQRDPLSKRLEKFFNSRRPAGHFSQASSDYANIYDQVNKFNLRFLELEESEESTRVSVLKLVVKDAYLITIDGVSLPGRLRTLGIATHTRAIEEVNKLASYWRISQSLANLCRARSYRTLFASLQLETLQCYQPSLCVSTGQQQFVHAEIQTIVHYETSSSVWPRVIGSSKKACFLCDAFIMAHGFFHISKAHRQVFPQWTVPDLREYSNETLARLRNTLVVVDRAIIRELGEARPYQEFRPLPLQSSINLQKPILLTPSLSTIGLSEHESARTASPIISCQESRLVTPTPAATEAANGDILIPAQVTTTDANSLLARAPTIVQSMRGSVANQMAIDQGATDAGELHLHLSDTPHIIEAVKTKPEARDGISLAVSPTSPAELDLGWLNLSIELEDGLEAAFSKAEVTVSCAQECRPGMRRCINLADLVSGEQRLLKRSDDEHGLEFTIANCSEDVVKIKCTWLAA